MTSTTDMPQHPDVSEISDLTEGLLSPARTADVQRHLDGCGLCGDVHASLEEIRGLLGALPAPEPMPDDVAARIDAVLAVETLITSPASDRGPDVSRETSGSVSRETEPVIAADTNAALVDRPAGHSRGPTGPGRGPTRSRRRTAILGTAFGAVAVGVSVFMLQTAQPSPDATGARSTESGISASADSGRQTFSESTLQRHVQALLHRSAPPGELSTEKRAPSVDTGSSLPNSAPASPLSPPSSPNAPMRTEAFSVPPCVQKGTGRATPALTFEEGMYDGTDVFLVVLPHATDIAQVQAYMVDASCVGDGPAARGQLLMTRAYPRS
ncbi:anti-sigma factor family protein [Streptomyces sp. DT24]|uniref:anti-sigma factor family protein n=1 Tax=Streptomyces sp. DT24 TaxID=3416520 RepID=UPI003CEBABA0